MQRQRSLACTGAAQRFPPDDGGNCIDDETLDFSGPSLNRGDMSDLATSSTSTVDLTGTARQFMVFCSVSWIQSQDRAKATGCARMATAW